ncbi:hypothetical protein ENUP19_0054G0112 [Entamoeba nuttalli]|uniref:Uncharacterized protein n=2 Tax=Entamoeba nuttalli TaxID=412467 RepID=K2I021_ENTNP|nr:hypothetical protein ENU1_033360 [Entamoeba nuttalli P19]EKE42080.1 hypothetical protein ENU1_033360 [Entamoeba nuttalli P19]|eukprot:XP_008855583.1 hypothetical protein ENU1_033360 [Entamoeba nuttalli P19]
MPNQVFLFISYCLIGYCLAQTKYICQVKQNDLVNMFFEAEDENCYYKKEGNKMYYIQLMKNNKGEMKAYQIEQTNSNYCTDIINNDEYLLDPFIQCEKSGSLPNYDVKDFISVDDSCSDASPVYLTFYYLVNILINGKIYKKTSNQFIKISINSNGTASEIESFEFKCYSDIKNRYYHSVSNKENVEEYYYIIAKSKTNEIQRIGHSTNGVCYEQGDKYINFESSFSLKDGKFKDIVSQCEHSESGCTDSCSNRIDYERTNPNTYQPPETKIIYQSSSKSESGRIVEYIYENVCADSTIYRTEVSGLNKITFTDDLCNSQRTIAVYSKCYSKMGNNYIVCSPNWAYIGDESKYTVYSINKCSLINNNLYGKVVSESNKWYLKTGLTISSCETPSSEVIVLPNKPLSDILSIEILCTSKESCNKDSDGIKTYYTGTIDESSKYSIENGYLVNNDHSLYYQCNSIITKESTLFYLQCDDQDSFVHFYYSENVLSYIEYTAGICYKTSTMSSVQITKRVEGEVKKVSYTLHEFGNTKCQSTPTFNGSLEISQINTQQPKGDIKAISFDVEQDQSSCISSYEPEIYTEYIVGACIEKQKYSKENNKLVLKKYSDNECEIELSTLSSKECNTCLKGETNIYVNCCVSAFPDDCPNESNSSKYKGIIMILFILLLLII